MHDGFMERFQEIESLAVSAYNGYASACGRMRRSPIHAAQDAFIYLSEAITAIDERIPFLRMMAETPLHRTMIRHLEEEYDDLSLRLRMIEASVPDLTISLAQEA